MSDVKRTLKVVGIIGALEWLFLQEISEARTDQTSTIFGREQIGDLSNSGRSQVAVAEAHAVVRDIGSVNNSGDHLNSVVPLGRPTLPSSKEMLPSEGRAIDSLPQRESLGMVKGSVLTLDGDQSLSRDRVGSSKKPMAETTVYIFEGKFPRGAAPRPDDPRAIKVTTNRYGQFHHKLQPGTYTLFIEVNGSLYSKVFDRNNQYDSIKIEKGGDPITVNLEDGDGPT